MLKVESLACRRGRRLIFRNVGFAVGTGGILRVTGRNGSGKSSLLRMLAGLLPPFDGALYWDNERVTDFAEHRERLHYIGHLDGLKPELTAGEMISYWCALRKSPSGGQPDILAAFGLASLGNAPIRFLSAGQKRRLALTRLSLSDAPLWLLDEPSTALDRKGQELLASLIAAHRVKGGMAVVAAHHDLDVKDAQDFALDRAAA